MTFQEEPCIEFSSSRVWSVPFQIQDINIFKDISHSPDLSAEFRSWIFVWNGHDKNWSLGTYAAHSLDYSAIITRKSIGIAGIVG